MNTIIVNKDRYYFENQEINLAYKSNLLELNIKGKVIINDLNNNDELKLTINLADNSELIYNRFNKDFLNNKIEINILSNDTVEFNQSIYENKIGNYQINCNVLGDNNNIVMNVYAVSNNMGKNIIEATGDIKKHIKNNKMLENIRILTLNNEENIIIPNLLVSSEEVMVNHNATISSINEDYLFYLMSQGLSEEGSCQLIISGFIFSKLKLDDQEKEQINF